MTTHDATPLLRELLLRLVSEAGHDDLIAMYHAIPGNRTPVPRPASVPPPHESGQHRVGVEPTVDVVRRYAVALRSFQLSDIVDRIHAERPDLSKSAISSACIRLADAGELRRDGERNSVYSVPARARSAVAP